MVGGSYLHEFSPPSPLHQIEKKYGEARECHFTSKDQKRRKIRRFLRKYGDDLPDSAIKRATNEENVDNFAVRCDGNNKIIAGATFDDNDWYLCTIHYLAVAPEHQGKGLGKQVTREVIEKTRKDPNCLVLAADITFDNFPSKAIFEREGFEETTRFCWGKGEDPADILHYAHFPPKKSGEECGYDPRFSPIPEPPNDW